MLDGHVAVQTLLIISYHFAVEGQVVTQERVGEVDAKVMGSEVHLLTHVAAVLSAKYGFKQAVAQLEVFGLK